MAKFDVMKIVGEFISAILKFFDNAYRQGWLLYLLIGLVVLFVFIIFQRSTYVPVPAP